MESESQLEREPGSNATSRKDKELVRGAEGRRSRRVTIAIPVLVYGKSNDEKIFYEETSTRVVNAHGGMVSLQAQVSRGQQLVLVNPKNGNEVKCRVAYMAGSAPPYEVGLEFETPQPRFWGIAFPPPDWLNADRKRPEPNRVQNH